MKDLIERIRELCHNICRQRMLEEHYGNDIKYFEGVEYCMYAILEIINEWEEQQENKTFYDRLKEERAELAERLDKLNVFLHKIYLEGTAFVTDTQAHYLKEQMEYMRGYLDILDKRLENLKESTVFVIGNRGNK